MTGITDTMVEGHQIDRAEVEQLVTGVHIVIAHNADFDRKLAERFWPIFAHRHWACSATGIDWKGHGFGGARLPYLLAEVGLFHDAHRALDDCHAALEILARDLPGTGTSGLAALLDRARRPQHRIWAVDAPYALKPTDKLCVVSLSVNLATAQNRRALLAEIEFLVVRRRSDLVSRVTPETDRSNLCAPRFA